MASSSGRDTISRSQVARTLTLLQSPEQIAIDLDQTDPLTEDDLAGVLQRVRRRHQSESLLARLPFGNATEGPMLGPGQRVPSTGAVLLAFHVGANLGVDTLATALGISTRDVGDELASARIALLGTEVPACDHMRAALGRYADPALDRESLSALINHSKACEQCGPLLMEFRAIDEEVRALLEAAEVTAPASTSKLRSLRRNPLYLLVPITLVVILAIAALAAIGFGAATQSGPMPLFAAGKAEQHPGWLILSSEHEVMAIDLASTERRRILENPAHDWWNPWIISPGAQLVVRWEENTRIDQRVGALRAYDMQGDRQYLHRWTGPRSRTFSGWLDDHTVLFAERGPIQRIGVHTEIPDAAQPALIAADLETGDEWTVYHGPMDKAVPSPDGQYVAIVRPAAAPWPGKTLEILPIEDGLAGTAVNTVEHRLLGWPGRLVWSVDSQQAYVSAIDVADLPDTLPAGDEPAPGPYSFERLPMLQVGIDGAVSEFAGPAGQPGWFVPQAISPDSSRIAIVHNGSGDRDSGWHHGSIDVDSGEIEISENVVPGERWWNSEALWSLDGASTLSQAVVSQHFGIEFGDDGPGALAISATDTDGVSSPILTFHDLALLSLRSGTGLGLLRWVPDDAMRSVDPSPGNRPRFSSAVALRQASDSQALTVDSAVATTGRHVLLQQDDPDAGTEERLIHLQAWGGTRSDRDDARSFSWLPREAVAIGVTESDQERGLDSSLIFLSTDPISPLHNREIDPAGISGRATVGYRAPAISPNGSTLAFFVANTRYGDVELWTAPWNQAPRRIAAWEPDEDARLQQALTLMWISDHEFVFSQVTSWANGYPTEVTVKRGEVSPNGAVQTETIRVFTARGRDRGINLVDIALSPDNEQIAFRLRHYTGSDVEIDRSDSIVVSPAQDLNQQIEIIRSGSGEGLIWLPDGGWLVAGIDDRIVLIESTGRDIENLAGRPSAFPVLAAPGEIWFQDLADDGTIMVMTFE